MAANQFLSLPAVATGLSPASPVTAWSFGSWVEASAALPIGTKVIGFQFQVTFPAGSLDTTFEILFEIGKGASGSEAVQAQVPFSHRLDTAVGYYLKGSVMFPEPFTIIGGTRVAVRVTDSITSVVTYQGVKLLYEELKPPTVTLQLPTDTAINQSITPQLDFTGTDADGDSVEYNVQVDTLNTFNSVALGYDLKTVDVYIQKIGSPTDNIFIEIRSTSITGTILATSDNVLGSTLSGTSLPIKFTLPNQLTLTANTKYYITINRSTLSRDTVNFYIVSQSSSDAYPLHGSYIKNDGAWTLQETDLNFVMHDSLGEAKFSQLVTGGTIAFYGAGGTQEACGQSYTVDLGTSIVNSFSLTDAGFTAGHPYASGVQKSYTVQSTLTTVSSYSETNYSGTATLAGSWLFGQTFAGTGFEIGQIKFWLKRFGSGAGNVFAKIYAHTGTFGVDGLPTGLPLATSNAFDASAASTAFNYVSFTFSTPFATINGTNYVVVLDYAGGNPDANYIDLGNDSSSPTNEGNAVGNVSGSWGVYSFDFIFSIHAVSGLSSNTTYYWRVRAVDPKGSNVYGAWSAIRSFTTRGDTIVYKGILKIWNGTAWVKTKLKRWNGTAWVTTRLRRWDGTNWKDTDTTGI